MYRIGVISDTHGHLRPKVFDLFAGVDRIIHAGDIGDPTIVDSLRTLAPVIAVRGNVDKSGWADGLKDTELFQIGQILIYVLHDLSKLDLVPSAAGIRVVVYGHSHRAEIRKTGPVLYLNPGSAGPHRFNQQVSCASIEIDDDKIAARILELD